MFRLKVSIFILPEGASKKDFATSISQAASVYDEVVSFNASEIVETDLKEQRTCLKIMKKFVEITIHRFTIDQVSKQAGVS